MDRMTATLFRMLFDNFKEVRRDDCSVYENMWLTYKAIGEELDKLQIEEVRELMRSDRMKLNIEFTEEEIEIGREKILKQRQHIVKRLKEELGVDVELIIK